MIPESYFYLVDADTLKPLVIISRDDCHMRYEFAAREGQIRARYKVDDVESGLLLRDGHTAPLPREAVRAVLADMKRKGVSPIWPPVSPTHAQIHGSTDRRDGGVVASASAKLKKAFRKR